MSKILLIFLCASNFCCVASAQVVRDPIADTANRERQIGSYYPGRSYYKWIIDINHDGVSDVLVSEKERSDEIDADKEGDPNFNPNDLGFHVYLGLATGGYITGKPVKGDESGGTGISVDMSHCYIGYVPEVKSYGIVTVETLTVDDPNEPQARHGVFKRQVVCYTVDGDHLKRTNLTPLWDAGEKNPVYNKYLSDSKRSKVQLQQVTP